MNGEFTYFGSVVQAVSLFLLLSLDSFSSIVSKKFQIVRKSGCTFS